MEANDIHKIEFKFLPFPRNVSPWLPPIFEDFKKALYEFFFENELLLYDSEGQPISIDQHIRNTIADTILRLPYIDMVAFLHTKTGLLEIRLPMNKYKVFVDYYKDLGYDVYLDISFLFNKFVKRDTTSLVSDILISNIALTYFLRATFVFSDVNIDVSSGYLISTLHKKVDNDYDAIIERVFLKFEDVFEADNVLFYNGNNIVKARFIVFRTPQGKIKTIAVPHSDS